MEDIQDFRNRKLVKFKPASSKFVPVQKVFKNLQNLQGLKKHLVNKQSKKNMVSPESAVCISGYFEGSNLLLTLLNMQLQRISWSEEFVKVEESAKSEKSTAVRDSAVFEEFKECFKKCIWIRVRVKKFYRVQSVKILQNALSGNSKGSI